jgi:hypothetical protein
VHQPHHSPARLEAQTSLHLWFYTPNIILRISYSKISTLWSPLVPTNRMSYSKMSNMICNSDLLLPYTTGSTIDSLGSPITESTLHTHTPLTLTFSEHGSRYLSTSAPVDGTTLITCCQCSSGPRVEAIAPSCTGCGHETCNSCYIDEV